MLITPDGRYLVVCGKSGPRLWRASNPELSAEECDQWVAQLMAARRAVRSAKGDAVQLSTARQAVDEAKRALGERGVPWWTDGAADLNRRLVKNTAYWDWYSRADDQVS